MEIVMLILLVYGICNAFFGYKLYRFWIGVSGFCVGALIGAIAGILTGETAIAVLGAIIVGALGAWLSIALWKIGVFLQCFCYGFIGALIPLLLGQLPSSEIDAAKMGVNLLLNGSTGMDFTTPIVLALILGILIGILGLIFTRVIIIFTSGITGGFAASLGICMMLGGEIGLILLIASIIALLGICVQIYTTDTKNENKVAQRQVVQEISQQETQQASIAVSEQLKATGTAAAETLQTAGKKTVEGIEHGVNQGAQKIRERQKKEAERATQKESVCSIPELLEQLESVLYKNKYLAWVLPFTREIAVILTIIFAVLGCVDMRYCGIGVGIFYGLEKVSSILLFICGLSIIKRDYITALIISVAEMLVSLIYGVVGQNYLITDSCLLLLLNFVFYIVLVGVLVKKTIKPSEVLMLHREEGKKSTDAKVFCSQCGAELKSGTKFCTKCGKELR